MDEADAQRVLVVREFESGAAPAPWSDADRSWADRTARANTGAQADFAVYLSERARLVLDQLTRRLPELPTWLAARRVPAAWIVASLIGACGIGAAADQIGALHHINLLAPPIWGVLAWNALVYALLLASALRLRQPRAGGLAQLMSTWSGPLRAGADAAVTQAHARTLQARARAWVHAGRASALAQATAWLHALAAALALGIIGGLYLRGLVFDIRAGWQSTFLDATSVHTLLSFVLAPASLLTGIDLPDVDAVQALHDADGTASAAPWIHLLAATLVLGVVLPRLLLAAWCWARARRAAAQVSLPLHEPYFQRLMRAHRGSAARVRLVPHAHTPSASAQAALADVLARVLGPHLESSRLAPVEFGAEDDASADELVPSGTTHVLLLAELSATPEAEHHGRLATRLAAAAATHGATMLICVDESAFLHRFAAWPQRATERRAAWAALAASCGVTLVVLDLGATGAPGAAAAGAGALQRGLDAAALAHERRAGSTLSA